MKKILIIFSFVFMASLMHNIVTNNGIIIQPLLAQSTSSEGDVGNAVCMFCKNPILNCSCGGAKVCKCSCCHQSKDCGSGCGCGCGEDDDYNFYWYSYLIEDDTEEPYYIEEGMTWNGYDDEEPDNPGNSNTNTVSPVEYFNSYEYFSSYFYYNPNGVWGEGYDGYGFYVPISSVNTTTTPTPTPTPTPAPIIPTTPPVNMEINFAAGINSETVGQTTHDVLQAVMQCADISSLTITSTTRTPESQASAMYDNCVNLGVNNQKNLYAWAGDQVIDVYSEGKDDNLNREQIISQMVTKIIEVGPTNVSKHCADPSELNVIDISPSSISNPTDFENCLSSNSGISNFITPPEDPVYHIEITQ